MNNDLKLRTIIVDDEPLALELLESYEIGRAHV